MPNLGVYTRPGKRSAQAARQALVHEREETRRLLLGLLGGRDFVVMLDDLSARGPGAFPRWIGVLEWRCLPGEPPQGKRLPMVTLPQLVGRAYRFLGCERKHREAMLRALRK